MKPSMHINGIQLNKQKKLVKKKILQNLPSVSFTKYITKFSSHNLLMEIVHRSFSQRFVFFVHKCCASKTCKMHPKFSIYIYLRKQFHTCGTHQLFHFYGSPQMPMQYMLMPQHLINAT